ncbi:MAG: MaoC family dehydratase [Candidatus Dormibacteria bacterium]
MSSWDSLAVGTAPEPLVFGPVTRGDIVRYLGASGDLNPLHYDDAFAQAGGFPTVISVGMLQAAVMGSFATAWLGAENIRHIKARFKEVVFPGDVLTFTGSVVGKRESPEGLIVEIEMLGTRQSGGVAVQGWATFNLTEKDSIGGSENGKT